MSQSVFFIVTTRQGKYLAYDGTTTDVLDEAKVYHTQCEARQAAKKKPVRRIECLPGQETKLLP